MIATKPIEFRTNLKRYMDQTYEGEPVVVARPKNHNVVVISEESYNTLLKAQRNADYLEKLNRSYEELNRNQTITLTLEDLQAMESDEWKPTQKIKDFMEQPDK